MCADYKVFAKILGNRLKKVMGSVIHGGQFGIPGRSMRVGHGRIRDFLEGSNKGGILGLDWEKAYDYVDREFLFESMVRMGFGGRVVGWVRTLYENASMRVQVNGRLGSSVSMGRGLRQGCPLSQILFACMQNPFYVLVDGGMGRLGESGGYCGNIVGYVDDTTVLLNGIEDLRKVGRVIEIFGNATGMRVNKQKSRLLEVGAWVGGTLGEEFGWITVDRLKICGILFLADAQESRRVNSEMVMDRVLSRLRSLRAGDVTLHQRVVVVNTLIYSKVWGVAEIYPLRSQDIMEMQRRVLRYVWGYGRAWLGKDVVMTAVRQGGLGLIALGSRVKALYVKQRYIRVAGT